MKEIINKIKEKTQRWLDEIPHFGALKTLGEAHKKGFLEFKEEPAPRGRYHYKEGNGEKICLAACFFCSSHSKYRPCYIWCYGLGLERAVQKIYKDVYWVWAL